MQPAFVTVDTPEDLIPRMGNLPLSNARYTRSAVITRVVDAPPDSKEVPLWSRFGSTAHAKDQNGNAVEITAIAFSPDASLIASADSSGVVRIWNRATLLPTGKEIRDATGGISSIAFDASGALLATVDVEGTVRIWDVDSRTQIQKPIEKISELAVPVAFDSRGCLLVGPVAGSVALYDAEANSVVETLMPFQEGEFTATRAHFSNDSVQMVGGSGDGSVGFWREGGNVVQGIGRHADSVTCVALSPDGEVGISGGADGKILFWQSATGEAITFKGPILHNRAVRALAFNTDGSLIISGGDDGTVRMWNRFGFLINNPMQGTAERFTAVAFSPNADYFAAGGNDGSIDVWFDEAHAVARPLSLPIDREATTTKATERPSIGVLLTHRQSWTMEGIVLGPLLHSVCLAPGEITQIAISNHTRSVLENSADSVTQSEDLSQQVSSSSALSENESAQANSFEFGVSFGSSFGASGGGGAGGALGLLGVSAGSAVSDSSATNVSFSSGTKHVSDESTQSLHQRSTQRARLARSRFSASVREVSESDALELKTRVLANYNHMHALTVQYYEVMQVQRLTTTVTDAHRLIFIPMKEIEFAADDKFSAALQSFPHEITATLRGLGMRAAATCIDHLMLGYPGGQDLRQHRVDEIWKQAQQCQSDLDALIVGRGGKGEDGSDENDERQLSVYEALERREIATSDAVLEARDTLRAEKEPTLARRAELQRALSAAVNDAKIASEAFSKLSKNVSDLRKRLAAARQLQGELMELIGDFEQLAEDATKIPSAPAAPNNLTIDGQGDAPLPKAIGQSQHGPKLDETKVKEIEARARRFLVENQLAINQGLWMRLDPSSYAAMLDGLAFEGKPIGSTLDPTPVAVTGNQVGFRWHHENFRDEISFRNEYVHSAQAFQDAITLPTVGIFGEAVLGESNAADTIDITRFWNWKDALPPIRPTEIEPIGQHDESPLHAPTVAATPASAINLGGITFPEVSSGIPNIVDALKNPELFRDLSGMKASAALARSAMDLTASQSVETAKLASENFQQHLQLQQKIVDAALDAVDASGDAKTFDPTMAGAVINANAGKPVQPKADGSPVLSRSGAAANEASAEDTSAQISFETTVTDD